MSELSRLRGSEGCAACSDEVMAHRPTGSTQTDRIRLPYAAPEASRRAFFVKERYRAPHGKGETRSARP